MKFLTKDFQCKVKDINEEQRKVLISVSGIGNIDIGGDKVMPGAFTDTINQRGPDAKEPRIKHLLYHNPWGGVIGKPLEMTENVKDGIGTLDVLSVLANSQDGKDTFEKYKLNLFEHSIGYDVIKSEPVLNDPEDQSSGTKYIKLQEIKLWEYSSVTWGMNSNTPLIGIKSDTTPKQLIDELNRKIELMTKAIRRWNGSDEIGEALEIGLIQYKQINDILIASLEKQDPAQSTSQVSEPNESELIEVINSFNSKLDKQWQIQMIKQFSKRL